MPKPPTVATLLEYESSQGEDATVSLLENSLAPRVAQDLSGLLLQLNETLSQTSITEAKVTKAFRTVGNAMTSETLHELAATKALYQVWIHRQKSVGKS